MPDPKKLALLALDIIEIGKAMYDRFEEAKKGIVSVDAVRADLARFRSGIASNDTSADEELRKRFESRDG